MYTTKQKAVLGIFSQIYTLILHTGVIACMVTKALLKAIGYIAAGLWYTIDAIKTSLQKSLESEDAPQSRPINQVHQSRPIPEKPEIARVRRLNPRVSAAPPQGGRASRYPLPKEGNYNKSSNLGGK
tara:strand:+ start:22 stop:402 length:381 start_codon:yes stop_codon:yes gene_type:complete